LENKANKEELIKMRGFLSLFVFRIRLYVFKKVASINAYTCRELLLVKKIIANDPWYDW